MKRFLTVLFVIFVGSVAQAQQYVEKGVPSEVVTEATKGGYKLITLEELERQYLQDRASLLLIDTRQEWAYAMQHIAGAAYLSVTPAWWYQYSPSARSEMRKVLGSKINQKKVFY